MVVALGWLGGVLALAPTDDNDELVEVNRGCLSVCGDPWPLCDMIGEILDRGRFFNGVEAFMWLFDTVRGAGDLARKSDLVGGDGCMIRGFGDRERFSACVWEVKLLSDTVAEVTLLAEGTSLILFGWLSTTSTEISGMGPSDSSLSLRLPWLRTFSPKGFLSDSLPVLVFRALDIFSVF